MIKEGASLFLEPFVELLEEEDATSGKSSSSFFSSVVPMFFITESWDSTLVSIPSSAGWSGISFECFSRKATFQNYERENQNYSFQKRLDSIHHKDDYVQNIDHFSVRSSSKFLPTQSIEVVP